MPPHHHHFRRQRQRNNSISSCSSLQRVLVVVVGIGLVLPHEARAFTGKDILNPLQKGCLHKHHISREIRVCGSEDPPELAANGICRPSPFDYSEIRLLPSDWESTYFESWILQILLSEMLGVPTSVETGRSDASLNLYDPKSSLEYPIITDFWIPLKRAYNLSGDCGLADRSPTNYQVCGHFKPEAWGARKRSVQEMVQEGSIEPIQALGMLGQESWFVPKFTAERDPTLLSYIGVKGEANRQKLAERFKKPITWGEYCEQVSPDQCSTPDLVAERAPQEEGEHDNYFVQDMYTGYFRATPHNNCTLTPACRGYMMDYPCNWRSPVPVQTYHLDIALDLQLEKGGHSYGDLIQIWRAANATKSDVMFYWWSPDTLFLEFQGTEAEFTRVQLPSPTQACIEARVAAVDHCNTDLDIRYGSPEGVCQEPPNQLSSLMTSTVFHQSYDDKEEAIHSPAHAALSSFQITELQMEEIFALWNNIGDARMAVCQWVSENMDYMDAFVPRSYPRVVAEKDQKTPLMYSTTILGSLVAVGVIVMGLMVHGQQHRQAIRYAQMEFLDLLLLGALFIAIGAITIGVPSTSASCITSVWFVNIGYTLELVPLIVKIAAVTHVMDSGKKMKRVTISRYFLFGIVACISILVVIFTTIWTVIDPPTVQPEYELSDSQNSEGETLVWVLNTCQSQSMVWSYIAVGWNGILLLITSIYAIKMRKININGFCETPTLALLVYSHFVFVLLRVITYMLAPNVSNYVLTHCRSLIFSVDTLATLLIYFVPKFLAPDTPGSSRFPIRSESSWHSGVSGHSSISAFDGRRKSKEHVDAILSKQEQERATSVNSATLADIMEEKRKEKLALKAGPSLKCVEEGKGSSMSQGSSQSMGKSSGRRRSAIRASLVMLGPSNWAIAEECNDEPMSESISSSDESFDNGEGDAADKDTIESLRREISRLQETNATLSKRNATLEEENKALLSR